MGNNKKYENSLRRGDGALKGGWGGYWDGWRDGVEQMSALVDYCKRKHLSLTTIIDIIEYAYDQTSDMEFQNYEGQRYCRNFPNSQGWVDEYLERKRAGELK